MIKEEVIEIKLGYRGQGKMKEYIHRLEKEIQLLKRENKALADDNEMKCDVIAELKQALKYLLESDFIKIDKLNEIRGLIDD